MQLHGLSIRRAITCTASPIAGLRTLALRVLMLAGLNAATAMGLDVGFTSSQNKVYFEPPTEFAGTVGDTARLALAQNEYEAVQMVLFPAADMSSVSVEVSDLVSQGGTDTIPSGQIEVALVGYVNQLAAKVAGDRIGWIPDPLLPNRVVDLENGVLQPYLITVHALPSTSAGHYAGSITVSASGVPVKALVLEVEVWDFTLPDVPSFKTTSLTFRSAPDDMWPGQVRSEAHRDTLILRLADLGFRNRIPPTGALANGLLSWSWADSGFTRYGYPTHDGDTFNAGRTDFFIDYMLSKHASMFLIGYTFDIYQPASDSAARKASLIKYLRDYREHLAARGLLDMAYVYNIDEPWGDAVGHAIDIYDLIKSEVGSDLRVLQNTNQNNSSIIGTFLGHFDALDINLGHYYINDVDGYRASHPQALSDFWWNVNIWPDTHPNLFVEYPLVDARIFGSLSFKFNIQGFEYWNIKSQWSIGNYHPIDSGELRVQWDVSARSLDGSLVYPGANLEVYSSLRFESFRDGMEDYEYLALLAARDPLNPLLDVPVVTGLDTFVQDPFELLEFRRQVGEFLSGSPTGLKEDLPVTPRSPGVLGNYPNPFNPGTTIRFALERAAIVDVAIFNLLGQSVVHLHRGPMDAGTHELQWDGRTRSGREAPSGVYFCRLQAEDDSRALQMLLLR